MREDAKKRCMRCDWVSHSKQVGIRPCKRCGGYAIPVTPNMLKVTRKYFSLGYTAITGAEAFVSLIWAPDKTETTEIVYVYVEFNGYPETVFPDVPDGFDYFHDRLGNILYCGLAYHDAFPVGKDQTLVGEMQLKAAISRLYRYLCDLEERKLPQIYNLGGLL